MSAESYGEIQFYTSMAGFAYGLSMLGQSNTIVVYEAKKIKILIDAVLIFLYIAQ